MTATPTKLPLFLPKIFEKSCATKFNKSITEMGKTFTIGDAFNNLSFKYDLLIDLEDYCRYLDNTYENMQFKRWVQKNWDYYKEEVNSYNKCLDLCKKQLQEKK